MHSAALFSSEHKILLGISLLMCLLYYSDMIGHSIARYNNDVERAEMHKMERANDPGKSDGSFTIVCNVWRSPWEGILQLQILTNPLIFIILLYGRSFWNYVFAFVLNFITFWCFYLWAYESLRLSRGWSYDIPVPPSFGELLLTHSTQFEFLTFLSVSIWLLLCLFFLTRFVIAKLTGKIPLA
jgi:hypothetical protein